MYAIVTVAISRSGTPGVGEAPGETPVPAQTVSLLSYRNARFAHSSLSIRRAT
jgi:hypothetical protein